MSTDILASLIPKGCEPPKVEIVVGEGLARPEIKVEVDPVMSLEVLKQRLTGLPVNQYPILLALLVKGAWASLAFEEGKIGEFVKNLEAGLTAGIATGTPEMMVMFGMRAQQKLEDLHDRVSSEKEIPIKEREFYKLAGEELRLRSALKEFQDADKDSGGESGPSQGA